jgi:16S rRNA C1402 N4-methylase RsmH
MPTYPRSILKTTSTLNELLGLDLDLTDLEQAAAEANRKLNALMEQNDEFRELVAKLEEAYEYEESPADEMLLRRLIDGIDLEDGAAES